ncbi:hypothetical protein [uncultured Nostoc sp.]
MCLLVLKKVFHERALLFLPPQIFGQSYIISPSAIAVTHSITALVGY